MKILICDSLNEKVLKELQTIGECIDISSSQKKHEDLETNIEDAEIVVIRSGTQLDKAAIDKGKSLKIKGKSIETEMVIFDGSVLGSEKGHF